MNECRAGVWIVLRYMGRPYNKTRCLYPMSSTKNYTCDVYEGKEIMFLQ